MRSVELVKEPGFSNKPVPRSAAGAEGRMWLLLWFLQGLKCTHTPSTVRKRKSDTHIYVNSKRKAHHRFLGWNDLAVKGGAADLKAGDPAKPLMNPGLVKGVT